MRLKGERRLIMQANESGYSDIKQILYRYSRIKKRENPFELIR